MKTIGTELAKSAFSTLNRERTDRQRQTDRRTHKRHIASALQRNRANISVSLCRAPLLSLRLLSTDLISLLAKIILAQSVLERDCELVPRRDFRLGGVSVSL